MLNIAIIDDEQDARSNLKLLIKTHCPRIDIVGEADGVQSGLKLIQKVQVDAIFLDIQMQDGTGFDFLTYFEQPSFYVIFATAFDHFAIKAFEYNAIDYLLKPIDHEQLERAVAKVIAMAKGSQGPNQSLKGLARSVDNNDFSRMVINTSEGKYFVVLNEIRYLQSDKNYTTFFMKDGSEITSAKTLGKYAELLPDEEFVRVHQSYLVRLDLIIPFVKNKAAMITLKDGEQIPISRRKKDLLIEKLRTSMR